jgi:hypothetical protein
LQQEYRPFDAAYQDGRRAHRAGFERRVNGSSALQKIGILGAVIVEHLFAIIGFDRCRRCTRSLYSNARNSHSQCSLLGVLNRALMSMNLIVFERQNLAIGVVDDKRVNIQSLKMCRLSCIAIAAANRRIEPQIKRRKKSEKSERIALGAE